MFASFEVCSPASIRTFKALTATKATGSPKMSSMLRPCDRARTLPCRLLPIVFSGSGPSWKASISWRILPSFSRFHAAAHRFVPTPASKAAKRLQREDKAVTREQRQR